MSFKIVCSDNNIFKSSFESIGDIVDEVIMIIDSEGFRINAIDRSHIAFVTLDLQPTVFDEFECEEPEKVTIDTQQFVKILKRMKSDDILSLSSEEGNFIVKLSGDAEREFKIRLIDVEYETPQPPAIEIPCMIHVKSDIIKDCITDMDYFKVFTDGEFGDGEVKYLHGEYGINEVVKSSFSIDKLKQMMKSSKFSNDCEIGLGTDMPLILNFVLPSDDGKLGFLLAPRLEEKE